MKTDLQLQSDVIKELEWEPSVLAAHIGVTADDGLVTLTGHVPVYAQKLAAESVAKRVHGVKAVANEIEVRLPGGPGYTDEDIASAALHALKWDARVPHEAIQITVRDARITLQGTVDRQCQKEAAAQAVRNLAGAREVTNSIIVRPGGQPGATKSAIEEALLRHANLDSEQIEVQENDGVVALIGDVHSCAERDEAGRVAWAAPGVRGVQNRLQVTPW